MDPAVIAAVVTTPTAVLAAAAAYAAGRAQARAAQRGPVDAVRRQHQRDAYAAFLVAASTYASKTHEGNRVDQARAEIPDTGDPQRYRDQIRQRVRELLAEAAGSLSPIPQALALVQLEGPAHVAELAERVELWANMVDSYAGADTNSSTYSVQRERQAHRKLKDWIEAYVKAARDHLNAGEG
ncbi:hypothetical protein ACWEWD_38490 [Streptomyces tendae]